MSKTIEVIRSVERRRRWSPAEKERPVAASLEAGANLRMEGRAVTDTRSGDSRRLYASASALQRLPLQLS